MTHSPELHTDTLDALPTPAVVAVSGQIVHANPACLVLLEAEQADQVLGRSYSDFTHPLDLARARRRVQALSQGGTPGQRNQSTSYRMQTCCGNTRMVLLASAKVLWQGQPALLVSGIDMTHLDRLQHEMQESERNFRRLFEKMQDVYYRTDAQGVVQHVGPGVRRAMSPVKSKAVPPSRITRRARTATPSRWPSWSTARCPTSRARWCAVTAR